MMKSFQRLIALFIMLILTLQGLNSFAWGEILGPYNLFRLIGSDNPALEFQHNSKLIVVSVIANIIALIFYILMARELYLMYKFGKEEDK